jgi:hypothetical protein
MYRCFVTSTCASVKVFTQDPIPPYKKLSKVTNNIIWVHMMNAQKRWGYSTKNKSVWQGVMYVHVEMKHIAW